MSGGGAWGLPQLCDADPSGLTSKMVFLEAGVPLIFLHFGLLSGLFILTLWFGLKRSSFRAMSKTLLLWKHTLLIRSVLPPSPLKLSLHPPELPISSRAAGQGGKVKFYKFVFFSLQKLCKVIRRKL